MQTQSFALANQLENRKVPTSLRASSLALWRWIWNLMAQSYENKFGLLLASHFTGNIIHQSVSNLEPQHLNMLLTCLKSSNSTSERCRLLLTLGNAAAFTVNQVLAFKKKEDCMTFLWSFKKRPLTLCILYPAEYYSWLWRNSYYRGLPLWPCTRG